MRSLLALTLLAVMALPVVAQENKADKLFKSMEDKLRTAKTLRCQFDSTLTAGDEKVSLKGTLTLGEGDKLRLEFEIKSGGKAAKLLVVSDGTNLSRKDSSDPKTDQTKQTPNGLGAHARVMLPRCGIAILENGLNRPRFQVASPELYRVSDFKLLGKEEIGKRNAQVIEYTVTEKKDVITPGTSRVKMWLDAESNLPVKLAWTTKDADITTVIEVYSEFTLDAKIDAKLLELSK
jgi:outer membrane lipoprotein-sorting protein